MTDDRELADLPEVDELASSLEIQDEISALRRLELELRDELNQLQVN